jgi:hypothetical protein
MIPAQKVRFWKTVILLFVAFAAYVIYLNFVGSHLRASDKKSPAQFAEHQQQKPLDDAGSVRKGQPVKAPSSTSPVKLTAVVLKSIPHDTAAFTQVRKLFLNFIQSHLIVIAAGLVL